MHIPVLLKETLEYLNPQSGQKFIDATVDGGGHAVAILEQIEPGGKLLGIEWDGQLLAQLKFKIQNSKFKNNVILINDSYVNLKKIAEENNFLEADGILFDLGMSSWHLEESGRGFSFQKDEPLDMRYRNANLQMRSDTPTNSAHESTMRPNAANEGSRTAVEIVNKYSYDELVKILKDYGQERFAKSIAAKIVKTRKDKPIRTTLELAEVIKTAVPFWYRRGRIHFATRTFQALRIAVNRELENIESGIGQAIEILRPGGRIAIISFHSLEDRIIKNFFKKESKEGRLRIETKKPIVPDLAEITENPRARSAKLRVATRTASSL